MDKEHVDYPRDPVPEEPAVKRKRDFRVLVIVLVVLLVVLVVILMGSMQVRPVKS